MCKRKIVKYISTKKLIKFFENSLKKYKKKFKKFKINPKKFKMNPKKFEEILKAQFKKN